MNGFLAIITRDVRSAYGNGGVWLPIIFYLCVATLFPFAVGPDQKLLGLTGGGILWIAALLATLLPIDRLIMPDQEQGVLDQLVIRGYSDELIATAKIIAHWLSFGPPLLLATIAASALMGLDGPSFHVVMTGLAIATPALASLAVMVSSLTAGLRGAGALGGLLLVPLAIPILIFGAGALTDEGNSALQLLAATCLLIFAISPFAAGAALRAGRE